MEKRYSKLKEEIMDLFGTISVEEIIKNRNLSRVLKEISSSLDHISISDRYQIKEGVLWKR